MKKILIVDDDNFITTVYKNRFLKEGFHADIAANGVTALEMLKKESWDLVLLDLQLPDLSGVEILKFIRAEPSMQELPVVVFSNAYLNVLVEAAWQAGATQLLTKSQCTPNQLVDTVRKALEAAPPKTFSQKRVSVAELKMAQAVKTAAPPALPRSELPKVVAPRAEPAADTQVEFRQKFLDQAPAVLTSLREQVRAFLRAKAGAPQSDALRALSTSVHALIGGAAVAGLGPVAQMASALEALFEELRSRPGSLSVSTLRTVVRGVEALEELCNRANTDDPRKLPPLALVVDDDEISRQAVCAALQKVQMRSVAVADPALALSLVEHNDFELALLDVNMPGMDGMTLCHRMRALPRGQVTRVIFVTAINDFEKIAGSNLLEKNEVIGKPFPLIELAVKALTYILNDAPVRERVPEPARVEREKIQLSRF